MSSFLLDYQTNLGLLVLSERGQDVVAREQVLSALDVLWYELSEDEQRIVEDVVERLKAGVITPAELLAQSSPSTISNRSLTGGLVIISEGIPWPTGITREELSPSTISDKALTGGWVIISRPIDWPISRPLLRQRRESPATGATMGAVEMGGRFPQQNLVDFFPKNFTADTDSLYADVA